MKANAPEKLYISDSELNDAEHCIIWFKNQQNESDIEYTRTDAFIEKACEYLSYHLDTSKIDVQYKFDFIEQFRKYMEGE